MSAQNSLQVASGDAVELTNTPANNKKCSTKSMLLLGTGAVFIVIGIALGAYHAGTDAQKSAANSALESVKEKIEGIFGDDEEQLAAIVDVLDEEDWASPAPDTAMPLPTCVALPESAKTTVCGAAASCEIATACPAFPPLTLIPAPKSSAGASVEAATLDVAPLLLFPCCRTSLAPGSNAGAPPSRTCGISSSLE